ncbi:molybdopterin cofactor-binding domain-containing protein, partial [Pseudomonas viridiflava]|uniref:molybdopterin cofactor-binding domain-containing protein n=1 Tax=Pseudomonas viridiflava TaxID=33069 RepID=UPI0013E08ACC
EQCAVQDIGTGTYTVVAQTVSQLTGVPMANIEVELGSSSFPAGPVSGGSWVTSSIMPALAGAVRQAMERVRGYAVAEGGPFAKAGADTLTLEP